MTGSFDGEVALLTGGSSGIGRAAALAFATEGAKVAIASRRESESLETVKMIEDAGGEGFFIKADISKSADVQSMPLTTPASRGRPSRRSSNIRRRIGTKSSPSI
jgi:NAD(P)-dependent dehydrogenase (short-subunit alcohol dehydrogenase family)